MLVPCPVGSPTDVSARSIARWWSENSERAYYVENLPIRTASVDTSAIAAALVDKNTMLFDLGDCANEASIPE
jgi:tripartite-type tricarboxylate transporter receptor subunit TctC